MTGIDTNVLVRFLVRDDEVQFMWKETSAQFADCLIGARHWELECLGTASFDAKALRLPGFIGA